LVIATLSECDNDSDRVTLCPGWSLGVDALMYGLLIACSQGQAVARFLHDGSALGARVHDPLRT